MRTDQLKGTFTTQVILIELNEHKIRRVAL